MEDTLLALSCPFSSDGIASVSVAENDRFRDERNEAGEREGWRSSLVAIDAKDASRLSSLAYLDKSWWYIGRR
jgi:hypothetical protein